MSYLDKIKVADTTYDIKDSTAASSADLAAEAQAREQADGNLQTAINGKQAALNADQMKAVNSGADSTKIGQIATNTSAISDLQTAVGGKQAALDSTQMAAVNSGIDSTKVGQIATNTGDISTINGKIPSAATSSNQLADKQFVNSTVQTASANFRGNWAAWSNVPSDANDYPADADGNKTPTKNDYMVVQDASGFPTSPDPALAGTWRFKYSGTWATDGKNGWHPEYQVNETPLTSDQLAALNSGITAEAVSKLGDLANIKSIGANLSLNNTTGELTATDTTYTAGMNVSISSGNVISATDTTYSNFVGTDGTAAGTAGLVPAPATTDAGKFLKADGTWDAAGGDSGVYVMTMAYSSTNSRWEIENFDADALAAAIANYTTIIMVVKPYSDTHIRTNYLCFYAKEYTTSFYLMGAQLRRDDSLSASSDTMTPNYAYAYSWTINASTGAVSTNNDSIKIPSLRNNLTTTSAGEALDAAQGKVLKDLIDSLVIKNAGAPTTSTAGTKGQLLEDTTNGNLYICTNSASPYAWKQIDKDEILTNAGAPTTSTAGTLGQLLTDTTNAKLYQLTAIDTTDPQNPSYTWSEIGGSSGPTVVQTTGTSTTDVMSQNAVTNALASKEDIGTTETLTIADTDWSALSSSDPYDYSATVSVTATIGANSTVELLNDAAVDFATYGFAIGSVDQPNNTVTFYSIGAPSASKTLKVNVKG